MPPWIHHAHTSYVLAAYGVAGIGLLGLLLWSWRVWRSRQVDLRRVEAGSKGRRR